MKIDPIPGIEQASLVFKGCLPDKEEEEPKSNALSRKLETRMVRYGFRPSQVGTKLDVFA